MRFTVLPVHSLEDATLDLEQLQALLTTPSGQSLPFLQLLTAQNLQLAFGSLTVTYPGGAVFSNLATVTHGIGRVPKVILPSATLSTSAFHSLAVARNPTTTTFQVEAESIQGNPPAADAQLIWWLAIG